MLRVGCPKMLMQVHVGYSLKLPELENDLHRQLGKRCKSCCAKGNGQKTNIL